MAKKRKTLPDEFGPSLKNGTLEEQTSILLRCLPDATGDYNKYNAFGFPGISKELALWLIEYGTDINMPDYFGYTPLHHQAMYRNSETQIELYISLGADVNKHSHLNGGPLHGAADHGNLENVKILLAHGADLSIADHWGQTALEYMLSRCYATELDEKIAIVEHLLQAGTPVTDKMRQSVTRMGKDVEFRRSDYSADIISQIDPPLNRLYILTGVSPVPKRRFHDGISPITVTAQTWQTQYQELWDYLVPGSGSCKTVQGEVIRINGRVSHELLDNGGVNWDKNFRSMLSALKNHLASGNALSPNELLEASQMISALNSSNMDDAVNRLCQLSVQWVLANPDPIALGKTNYRR